MSPPIKIGKNWWLWIILTLLPIGLAIGGVALLKPEKALSKEMDEGRSVKRELNERWYKIQYEDCQSYSELKETRHEQEYRDLEKRCMEQIRSLQNVIESMETRKKEKACQKKLGEARQSNVFLKNYVRKNCVSKGDEGPGGGS